MLFSFEVDAAVRQTEGLEPGAFYSKYELPESRAPSGPDASSTTATTPSPHPENARAQIKRAAPEPRGAAHPAPAGKSFPERSSSCNRHTEST